MAIRYQISTWNSSTASEARDYATRSRIDAAQTELWRQIYAMCAADDALDTDRAHRLLQEFNAFCAAPHPLPSLSRYFSQNFVLRFDRAGALQHVKFVAIRDDRR